MRTARAPRRLPGRGPALVLAALLLAGCGGTGGDAEPAATSAPGTHSAPAASAGTDGSEGSGEPGEQADIVISDFMFHVPDSVPAGSELTVRNDDSVGHTVTSDEEGVFDVAVGPDEVVTFTVPAEPGEYPFHCIPHPVMTSTLVVR